MVYSTSGLNLNVASSGSQQVVFGQSSLLWNALDKETTATFQAAGSFTDGMASLFNGTTLIGFDDRGNTNDTDFQDFNKKRTVSLPHKHLDSQFYRYWFPITNYR